MKGNVYLRQRVIRELFEVLKNPIVRCTVYYIETIMAS